MKYQITISVNTLEVPISENIPQYASAIFESGADEKEECVGKILVGFGKTWSTFQKNYETNNYQQIILIPKNGETTLHISSSGKDIKLISKEKRNLWFLMNSLLKKLI